MPRVSAVSVARLRLKPATLIDFTEVRHRLLNDPPPDEHAAHHALVAMDLATILANHIA